MGTTTCTICSGDFKGPQSNSPEGSLECPPEKELFNFIDCHFLIGTKTSHRDPVLFNFIGGSTVLSEGEFKRFTDTARANIVLSVFICNGSKRITFLCKLSFKLKNFFLSQNSSDRVYTSSK